MAHVPVLLSEAVAGLNLRPGARCIDSTLGGAGHAEALCEAIGPTGRLLALDADPSAIERGRIRLARFADCVILQQVNFRRLAEVARALDFAPVDAVLLDLGVSSYQLEEAQRGFSLMADGPLDMRMDPDGPLTAAEIVNEWTQEELAAIIYRFGEESLSRRIARAIVAARPLNSTSELAEVVSKALGGRRGHRLHPATRVFQALRMAVNDELAALEEVLPQAVSLLAPGGRLGVITFQSLEDRLVKRFLQREARDCICDLDRPAPRLGPCTCGHRATVRLLTKKPIVPGTEELQLNPRSRSAKLRLAERVAV